MLKKIAVLSVLVMAVPMLVFAASVHIGGDYFLKGSEEAGDDIYVLAPAAAFLGTVAGDAVALSERITSEGDISADALLLGESVTLGGRVGDDARLVGARLLVSGDIADDLVVVGAEIGVLPEARVSGDLYALGRETKIAGAVTGSVRSFGRETRIDGSVGGNVEVWGDVSLGDDARVGGDLVYHAVRELSIPKEQVAGEIVFVEARESRAALRGLTELFSGLFSLQVLMMLAFSFALLFLLRERAEEVLLDIEMKIPQRALRGLIITLLVPLAAVLLLATVVGIPLGIALAAFFIATFLLASALAGIIAGAWMERAFFKRSPFPLSARPVLLGTLALALVSVIPYIGLLIHAVLLLAALGGVGTVTYRHLREVR